MRFIHLSDLHFHRDPADNVKADKVLKYVHKNYSTSHLVVTGDIVDDGHEAQYENALEALQPFQGRVFVVPGNHDFGAAGNFYSRERAIRFDRSLAIPLQQGGTFTGDSTPVVNVLEDDSAHVMLIGLDTNLETVHAFDFACGEVGEGQLAALDTTLDSCPGDEITKIVFFHHHPFMHGNPFMELKDGRQLMRTLYNRVHVVLFGHKHVSACWPNCNGINFVLAADNAPGKDFAREVVIEDCAVSVEDIPISTAGAKAKRPKKGSR